jgi:hypothetical protein
LSSLSAAKNLGASRATKQNEQRDTKTPVILSEAKDLSAASATEQNVTAQNTTHKIRSSFDFPISIFD